MTTEVETPTTEEVTPPQEAEEASNATGVADATDVTPESTPKVEEPDEELEGYLKDKGFLEEPLPEVKVEDPDAWLAEIPKSQRERVKTMHEREQRGMEQQKLQQTEQQRAVFTSLINTIDNHLRQALAGQVSLDPQAVLGRMKTAHDQLSRLVETTTMERLSESWAQGLKEKVVEMAPSSERDRIRNQEFKGYQDLLAEARDMARKGYVSEREHKAGVAEALRDYQRDLRKKGFLPGFKAPDEVLGRGGGSAGGGVPSIQTWTAMTLEQRFEALQKDPEIELKIMERSR